MKIKKINMSDCKDIIKSNFFCEHIDESDFKGRVCILKFEQVKRKWNVAETTCILDNGYIWIEFYPYNFNYCYTAIYDNKGNLVEWYIDITKKIEENNDIYIEDLFVDFVLLPNGKFFVLDEEELENAYSNKIVNKLDYETAIKVKDELSKKLKNINMIKCINFTNKYKERLIKNI